MEKHGVTEETLTEIGQEGGLAAAFSDGTDVGGEQDPEQALHGIRALAKPVQDHQAFVADMITAMDGLGNESGENPVEGLAGELTNVQINGDQATATVRKSNGEEDSIGFRKTDRGWRIHLDANMLRTQPTSTTPTF
jgi:hypothetical protein